MDLHLTFRAVPSGDIQQVSINGRAETILTISFLEMSLAVLGIAFRVYASRTGASRLRCDFWFVVGGTALGIVTETLFIMACKYGVGKHFKTLDFSQIEQALKYSWIGIYTGLMGTLIGKSAIVAILYQVATPTQFKRKALLLGICIFNVVIGSIQLVLSIAQGQPYYKLWYLLTNGTCALTPIAFKFGYFQGAVAVVVDFTLALYPITIVWNLQASLRTKVGFCVLMAGGVICAVAASMRTRYTFILSHPKDPTFDLVTFLAWASTELWFVVIIASIPPLRPLFLRWAGNTKKVISRSGTRSRTNQEGSIPLESISGPKTMTQSGSSEENILRQIDDDERIMVTKSYAIEVDKQMRTETNIV